MARERKAGMTSAEMAERLGKLEQSNRRLRIGGIVMALVAVAVFGFGAIKGDRVLEAEDLIIRDKQGNERARMAVDDSGPYLRLTDSKGHPRAILLVQDDRGLFLLPGGEKMQSELLLVNSGEPTIYLKDNDGQPRLEMSTKGDTVRTIMTSKDHPTQESMIMASSKDGPSLSCFDDAGKLRAQLSVFEGISRLSLLDAKQVQRVAMHAASDSAAFAVADDNEIRRAAMVYLKDKSDPTKEGAVVATFDRFGNSIFVSPSTPAVRNRVELGPRIGNLPGNSTTGPTTAPSSNANP